MGNRPQRTRGLGRVSNPGNGLCAWLPACPYGLVSKQSDPFGNLRLKIPFIVSRSCSGFHPILNTIHRPYLVSYPQVCSLVSDNCPASSPSSPHFSTQGLSATPPPHPAHSRLWNLLFIPAVQPTLLLLPFSVFKHLLLREDIPNQTTKDRLLLSPLLSLSLKLFYYIFISVTISWCYIIYQLTVSLPHTNKLCSTSTFLRPICSWDQHS